MVRGRPTKYKKEYCQRLLEWMGKGMSFESFAGEISVDRDTIYEWAKVHRDFSDAKRQASAKSQVFWEKMGIAGAAGQINGFNSGTWIFNMKNRFRWKDKQEVVTIDETFKPPSEMDQQELDERFLHAKEVIAKYASDTEGSARSNGVSGTVRTGNKKSKATKSASGKKAGSKPKGKK